MCLGDRGVVRGNGVLSVMTGCRRCCPNTAMRRRGPSLSFLLIIAEAPSSRYGSMALLPLWHCKRLRWPDAAYSIFAQQNPTVIDGIPKNCLGSFFFPPSFPTSRLYLYALTISHVCVSPRYSDATHKVAPFATVQDFWKLWNHMPQPSELLDQKRMVGGVQQQLFIGKKRYHLARLRHRGQVFPSSSRDNIFESLSSSREFLSPTMKFSSSWRRVRKGR